MSAGTKVTSVAIVSFFLLVGMCTFVADQDAWLYRGGFLFIAVVAAAVIAGITHPGSPLGGRYLFGNPVLVAIGLRRARLHGTASNPTPPALPPVPGWSPVLFEEIAAQLADGQAAAVHARMRRLAFEPDPEAPLASVESAIVTGWMHALEGRRAQAREQFEKALALAAPEWLAHPFLRAGPAVVDLVEELTGGRSEFARFVIARARTAGGRPNRRLLEELTPRGTSSTLQSRPSTTTRRSGPGALPPRYA